MTKLLSIAILFAGMSANAATFSQLNCVQEYSPALTVKYVVSVSPIAGTDDVALAYTQVPVSGGMVLGEAKIIAHHTDAMNYVFDNGLFELDPTLTFATFEVDGDVAAMICEAITQIRR